MVLWVMKWDIDPAQKESYGEWAQDAIANVVGAGGVVEFRAYRPVTGSRRVAVTIEFADLAAWQAWYESEPMQELFADTSIQQNLETELWGPSPLLPQPIRPGG
jgi:heme-degrading monooxygenase HmoA